jgi:RNA polymerase sigma-70 factor (ECF subfamily)
VLSAASDESLIDASRSGDRSALDALLRRHVDMVHAVCVRLAGNPADGADATQEALLAIVRGLPRFDGRSSVRTWMYRVATNACLDELRRRARRPSVGLPDAVLERVERADGPALDTAVVDRLSIDRALVELPEEFRVAVVLRDVAGFDYAQIAEVLDVPLGTVRSRIARGRDRLAELLGGNQDNPPGRPREHR